MTMRAKGRIAGIVELSSIAAAAATNFYQTDSATSAVAQKIRHINYITEFPAPCICSWLGLKKYRWSIKTEKRPDAFAVSGLLN